MLMKTKKLVKNDPLTGRLLSYSAAAGAILAIGHEADAQVIYTDVDPDVILEAAVDEEEIYELDLNNDGTIDLDIKSAKDAWYNYGFVNPRPGGGVVTSFLFYACDTWSSTYHIALKFEEGDLIDGELNFLTDTQASMGWAAVTNTCTTGQFHEESEFGKFLGVRISLDEGATHHYGWVRVEVDSVYNTVTVLDYAYEQIADRGIWAGSQSSLSVKDRLQEIGMQVYSANNLIIIDNAKHDLADAEVFNTAGQLLNTVQVQRGRNEIPVETNGLYFVRLKIGNNVVGSNKVVVN
jgi:hypothetical protein